MLYHLKFSGNSCLGNSARDFWGLKFWSRDFLGVSLEALGIFFWFWFLPPFNHPHHLKSGVPPWYIFFLFHFLEEHFLLHVRYMADSVAREDKANSVFWLATQAGKMAMVQHEKSYLCNIIRSFSDQGFLVKMARHEYGLLLCSLILTIHLKTIKHNLERTSPIPLRQ